MPTEQSLLNVLEAKIKAADQAGSWPETIKVLSADDISRGLPVRQPDKAQKCLTGWATDTFLYGSDGQPQHASAFMAFRTAFQIAVLESGKDYQHMGPFNDDGKQTEHEIATVFNSAAGLCGYKDGKR